MNIIIEPIEPDHYQSAIEMIQKTIMISQKSIYPDELREKFVHKYDLENFKKRVKEITYFVAVDEDANKVLGIIGLKDNELRTFFVDPDYQGKGIGRMLYNKLEQTARERGITKVVLFGSPLGEPAYIKFGFKKIKTVEKEHEGIKFLDAFMEKTLT